MTNTNEMENKVEMEVTEEVTVEETKAEKAKFDVKAMWRNHKKKIIGAVFGAAAVGTVVYLYVTGSKDAAEGVSEAVKEIVPDNVVFISDVIETTEEVV